MILVFGRGQLGEELAAAAARRQVDLVALPHREVDIADAGAVDAAIRASAPALVVNAAAYTKVDAAEQAPDEAFRVNAEAPRIVAAACARAGVPLVHISTDYVFDGTKPTAYVEDDPVAPLGVYGRSKAAGEAAVRETWERHVILRTSWVYGAYGANFLKTMLRLARERDELRVVADQRGCPTGTADLAEAILAIAPRLVAGEPVWGTYHLAGSGATTWHGFASAIVAAQEPFTGRRPPVVPIATADYPTPATRPVNSELDSSRFARAFGFRAIDWRDRTAKVVAAHLG